jgi:hypothetical protein
MDFVHDRCLSLSHVSTIVLRSCVVSWSLSVETIRSFVPVWMNDAHQSNALFMRITTVSYVNNVSNSNDVRTLPLIGIARLLYIFVLLVDMRRNVIGYR